MLLKYVKYLFDSPFLIHRYIQKEEKLILSILLCSVNAGPLTEKPSEDNVFELFFFYYCFSLLPFYATQRERKDFIKYFLFNSS